uniref:Uncharacterized protein n=1 Tax=Coccolithus braarudii TaxID=221442 RepID=A0A7S0LES1_9EUKA
MTDFVLLARCSADDHIDSVRSSLLARFDTPCKQPAAMLMFSNNSRCAHFVCLALGTLVSSADISSNDAAWLLTSPMLVKYLAAMRMKDEDSKTDGHSQHEFKHPMPQIEEVSDAEDVDDLISDDRPKGPRDSGDSVLAAMPGEPLDLVGKGWRLPVVERDIESGEPIPISQTTCNRR